jgi:hypothetical protein
VQACTPSWWEAIGRRIKIEDEFGKNMKPYLKTKLKQKKGWRHGSSDKEPA